MATTLDDDPRRVSLADATAGETLGGRYELLGLLGSGGMGTVYRAHDRELDEVVALKVIRRELVAQPDVVERFRREVKLARKVTHPSVARVYDLGEHHGEKFLTMELIEGHSLHEVLREAGPLELARASTLALAMCKGLVAAHDAGVVHRDLKPENVMLATDGRVVVMDFGVATALTTGTEVGLTQRAAIGTPAYMAPEQFGGDGPVDARTDLYALGCILFQLTTGRLPFPGTTVSAVLKARLVGPVPDPRRRRPELSDAWVALIGQLLAIEPSARPASARAVLDALQEIHGEQGVSTRAPTVLAPIESLRLSEPLQHTLGPPTGAPVQVPALLATTPSGAAVGRASTPSRGIRSVLEPQHTPSAAHRTGPQTGPQTGPLSGPPSGKTVAVLPFKNVGAPDDGFVADGLCEDLTDTLSMSGGLRVRPKSTVARYADRPDLDGQSIGRELGVVAVVEGSVRRAGNTLRVTARVITVEDGFQIWARRFDSSIGDLLTLSDLIARAVAEVLASSLNVPERQSLTDPLAVELYLRARQAYHGLFEESAIRALDLFSQALSHAPDDPMILSGYALAAARRGFFGDGGLDGARVAAERALTLAPDRAEALLALAAVAFQDGDLPTAVRTLRRALARTPNLPEAQLTWGRIHAEIGAHAEALRAIELALSLDPTMLAAHRERARLHWFLGKKERIGRPDPNDASGRYMDQFRFLCLWERDREAASRLLAEMPAQGVVFERARGVLAAFVGGAPVRDQHFRNEASTASRRRQAFDAQLDAELAALDGHDEAVVAAIARAVQHGLVDGAWLDGCPLLAGARERPEFPALRARVEHRIDDIRRALREP